MSASKQFLAVAALALLCPGNPAVAQSAAGQAAQDNAAGSTPATGPGAPAPVRPQCVHRQTDERPSIRSDEKLLTVWLAVPREATVDFTGWGTAVGKRWGALKITLLLDGVAVGQSPEAGDSEGTNIIHARADTLVKLLPGRQHKLTVRPEAPNKTMLGFEMRISIAGGCV